MDDISGRQWDSPGNLASYFSQNAWAPYGFEGDIWGSYGQPGMGDSSQVINDLTPEAKEWMQENGYTLQGSALPGDGNYLASLMGNGRQITSSSYNDSDPMFGMLVDAGVAAVTGGALGGGGVFGSLGFSPQVTGALNGAFGGGLSAAGREGDILQGIVSGGVGGYTGNTDFAKGLSNYGITNPAVQKGVTAAGASTLANLAGGNDLGSSLRSGAMSGITTGVTKGMNDFFGGLAKDYLGASDFGDLQGSGGDMSGQTDVSTSSYDEGSPNYRYSGDQMPVMSFRGAGYSVAPGEESSGDNALKSIQAYLPNTGQLGSFLGSNAGTLANLMFGLYNNRKQSGALQQQTNGLQGLFQQNSPYAQQLRAKLQAQAAARGTRANTAGRETQLQAQLADKAASLAPSLYQMQTGQNNLTNQRNQTLWQGFNQLGGLKGLQELFSNPVYSGGGANITGMQNPYGSDVVFNGWGG